MENTKLFLLSEFGKRFYVKAKSLQDAYFTASLYGAEVLVKRWLPLEFINIDPNTLKVANGRLLAS
jgi:hypothetical protein